MGGGGLQQAHFCHCTYLLRCRDFLDCVLFYELFFLYDRTLCMWCGTDRNIAIVFHEFCFHHNRTLCRRSESWITKSTSWTDILQLSSISFVFFAQDFLHVMREKALKLDKEIHIKDRDFITVFYEFYFFWHRTFCTWCGRWSGSSIMRCILRTETLRYCNCLLLDMFFLHRTFCTCCGRRPWNWTRRST